MDEKEYPLKTGGSVYAGELPDHFYEEMAQLSLKICTLAITGDRIVLADDEQVETIDTNITLTAMQRAFGLIIHHFFDKEDREPVLKKCFEAITENMANWEKK